MLKVATGWSDEPDTKEAVQAALDEAISNLGGATPKAGMVFAAIDFDLDILCQEIRARHPDLHFVGCTTDGEITGGEGFLEDAIVITLFASDTLDFGVGLGQGAGAAPGDASAEAVKLATAGQSAAPSLCIALPEGLGTNIAHVVNGLRDALGGKTPIVGGAAGDQLRFQGTKQFCNGTVTQDAIAILTLHGPLRISTGVATGYSPLSKVHEVTRAEGSTVHEIDGRPGAELYADYLQQPSIFFPLSVEDESRRSLVLSSPLNFDEATGALHLVNPVEQGSKVRIATASRDEIVDAARNSVGQAFANFEGKVEAALLFSCAGRRATLGTRTVEEYKSVETLIGVDVPTAGFYCYGEIGPDEKDGPSLTHTNAMVAVLLGTPDS